MNRKSLLVILAAVVLIAAVFAIAAFIPQNRALPTDAPSLPATETPAQPEQTADPAATAAPSADAYLLVTVGGMMYEPLPLAGEGSFTIRQDETITNTLHVTPDSIWMEHSSCDNQDCVQQGTVSLENMNTRVLSNMIICLPNQVVLELHTPETLESTFGVTF